MSSRFWRPGTIGRSDPYRKVRSCPALPCWTSADGGRWTCIPARMMRVRSRRGLLRPRDASSSTDRPQVHQAEATQWLPLRGRRVGGQSSPSSSPNSLPICLADCSPDPSPSCCPGTPRKGLLSCCPGNLPGWSVDSRASGLPGSLPDSRPPNSPDSSLDDADSGLPNRRPGSLLDCSPNGLGDGIG